jgi:hypothetical protein
MSNAMVAALIAGHLSDLKNAPSSGRSFPSATVAPSSSSSSSSSYGAASSLSPTSSSPHTPRVVVFGAAILDVIALPLTVPDDPNPDPNSTPKQALKGSLIMGTSNPGTVRMGYGGVGRNIAESLARLNTAVSLVSPAVFPLTSYYTHGMYNIKFSASHLHINC